MLSIHRGQRARQLFAATAVAAALALATPTAAFADPLPTTTPKKTAAASTDASSEPTQPNTDLLRIAAAAEKAPEANYDQKLAVAVKFGHGADSALIQKGDRDFVIGIWNIVINDPDQVEVRIAAEAAYSADTDTVNTACNQFITTDVYAALNRDQDRNKREKEAKRLSDQARAAAAASIDVVADAALLRGNDAAFALRIWERVADDPKWPKVKKAARAAIDGTPEIQAQFIATGMAAAAKQDTDDRIAAENAKNEAQKNAELARAAKKLAANRIGLTVTEELLNLPDRDFIIQVWQNTPDGSEVQRAAIAAVRSLDPAVWKTFIETGIHEAKDRDITLNKKYEADKATADQIKTTATNNGDLNLVYWTNKALAGTPAQLYDFLSVGQYDLALNTSFGPSDALPTWANTPAFNGGIANIGGICCNVTGPELDVRPGTGKTGDTALMYSGVDNSTTKSFGYLKAMALSRITIKPTTTLSYWIYPQTNTVLPTIKAANSTCVAIDLLFSDGSNMRDSGVKDTKGNRIHPQTQCNKLTPGQWNEVTVPLGQTLNGKKPTTLIVGYDQPANTGAYRGLIDDIKITD